jgi:tetratricopeptide (TPR) repeat protein
MAQAPSNPKIEELRFRLKTDPKNRIFYPLAEELRKVSQFVEAEHVLRTGLTHHPTYLSAWVSLGRVLRDQDKDADAIEALVKALQLDPGNVVAARLLADAYLAQGQKVEAIKKYKLVQALMPSDQDVEEIIARLEGELNPPLPQHVFQPPPEPAPEPGTPAGGEPAQPGPEPAVEVPEPVVTHEAAPFVEAAATPATASEPAQEPEAPALFEAEPSPEPAPFVSEEEPVDESPFAGDDAQILAAAEHTFDQEEEPADVVQPPVTHVASPFQEPNFDDTASSKAVASAVASEPAPPLAEPAHEVEPLHEVAPEQEVEPLQEIEPDVFPGTIETPFAMDEEPVAEAPAAEDLTETMTMADLYARQGLTDSAREIYDHILQRQPENAVVRAKLEALGQSQETAPELESEPPATGRSPKVAKLETWLAKVGHRKAGGV